MASRRRTVQLMLLYSWKSYLLPALPLATSSPPRSPHCCSLTVLMLHLPVASCPCFLLQHYLIATVLDTASTPSCSPPCCHPARHLIAAALAAPPLPCRRQQRTCHRNATMLPPPHSSILLLCWLSSPHVVPRCRLFNDHAATWQRGV